MPSFSLPALPEGTRLDVLHIDAAPLVRRVIERLDLPALLDRYLVSLPGRQPDLPSSTILCVLLANLLLARQPLYALSSWASSFSARHLGLLPDQAALLNDDRCGRALDHLFRSDRGSLFNAIVLGAIRKDRLAMNQFHQDTTTVTLYGEYAGQAPDDDCDRPARICRGYNKDHRPDLKQLVYDRIVTADGAVPVRCNILDGNTADDSVHCENWLALRELVGHAKFLYVADSKLASEKNLAFIDGKDGRFLTVMPKTHGENKRFRERIRREDIPWTELVNKANPRGKSKPRVSYHGYEDPEGSKAGYRIIWYLSSRKKEHDALVRKKKMIKAWKKLERLRPRGRGGVFRSKRAAMEAVAKVLSKEKVRGLLKVDYEVQKEVEKVQVGAGRPGPDTEYRTVVRKSWRIRVEENQENVERAARTDGIFPLMSNDQSMTLKEALEKYKKQPCLEKRHEQMKSVFEVMPVWLKNPKRVESLLWMYHLVDLVQALMEREVRLKMKEAEIKSLALYAEERHSKAPTTELILKAFRGHRCYRLLDAENREVASFHDPVTPSAETLLGLLEVDRSAYGLPPQE